MHNRIADRVSPERIARIESYRTAPRIPQETRFTFDAFERDPNYEVQDVPLREVPKWILAIIVAALIAVVLFVMLGWYVKNRVDQNTEVRRRNEALVLGTD